MDFLISSLPPCSLNLIVRTPWQIERGLKDDNWFLREIIEKGKVLYEARHRQMGSKSQSGMTASPHFAS
jgi:hypothetical protein